METNKKILYIDCGMGAAGDMLTASLLEAACAADTDSAVPGERVDRQRVEQFVKRFQDAGIPGVEMQVADAEKNGITGTHVKILVHGIEEGTPEEMQEWNHDHDHDHWHDHDHEHDHGHKDRHHKHKHHKHHHDDEHHGHDHSHHHDHDHGHDHSHHHDHDHDHSHHHDHDHDHSHDHNHGHDHDHSHTHHHGHVHRSMQDIEAIVTGLNIPEDVKTDVLSVYKAIAEAEGKVHGKPAGEVHFHEVGTLDAVADITAVCMLIREIAPDEIVASPVATGYGTVRCAHGVLPVPAPATALLLKGVPSYAGKVNGEICTPTGAALIGYFADRFGQMPAMRTKAIGYGMGTKDFEETANCLRVFLGEEAEMPGICSGAEISAESDLHDEEEKKAADTTAKTVTELSCNVDDMTGEEIGFASERLFAEGALDVYVVPIYMKKNRPGMLLRVMCRNEDKDRIVKAIFRYTSTIGIRENIMRRYVLHRETEKVGTDGMEITKKNVEGYGVSRSKYEYDDLAELARQSGCSLRQAGEMAERMQNSKPKLV